MGLTCHLDRLIAQPDFVDLYCAGNQHSSQQQLSQNALSIGLTELADIVDMSRMSASFLRSSAQIIATAFEHMHRKLGDIVGLPVANKSTQCLASSTWVYASLQNQSTYFKKRVVSCGACALFHDRAVSAA